MSWKSWVAAPFLLVLLFLTSCVIPIVIPIPDTVANNAKKVRYLAELEPPAQYNHPYDGPVVERVIPVAEVRILCMSRGADPGGVACSWLDNGTCYIFLPNNEFLPTDERAPISTYRRHEIAHCNGWPANHPHTG